MAKNRVTQGTISMITEPIKAARGRLTMSTPELWLMLAGTFATIYWIFKYLSYIGLPSPPAGPPAPIGGYGNDALQLNNLVQIIARILVFIAYGFTIYLTAMLSLYFDEKYRMSTDTIYSSNFIFTRIISPIARAVVLLIALVLITQQNPLGLPIPLVNVYPSPLAPPL